MTAAEGELNSQAWLLAIKLIDVHAITGTESPFDRRRVPLYKTARKFNENTNALELWLYPLEAKLLISL